MKIRFIWEMTLGHVSHYKNLHRAVEADNSVEAEWLQVEFARATGSSLYDRLENLPGIRNNWSLRAGIKTRQMLNHADSFKPEVTLFHTQTVSIFAANKVSRIMPVVISLDATPINYDTVGAAYGHTPGNQAVEFVKFKLTQRALQSAKRLITWSEWAKKSLIDDYKVKADILVVPPGTDINLWRRDPANFSQADQPVKLLFVGGAFKRKGGELLLNVFRQHFMDKAELHLVTQEQLTLNSNEKNRIFVYNNVTPNSDQMQQLFKTADVFVLPTEADCLPVVMGEAMASRLPIVTTRIGAIEEAVTPDYNGMLITPRDADGLTKALAQLIDNANLRRQMGENGYQRAIKDHDALKNGQLILDWCKELVPASSKQWSAVS